MKRESRTVDRSDQVDSRSQRYLPLVDLLVDTRAELMELAIASGLKVLETRLEEDRTVICGQRYEHQVARQASRAGTVPSEVVLGGRKVALRRPRGRATGAEVPLPTFRVMAGEDPLNRRVVEQMLVGVATRQYARSLDPLPPTMVSRGTSKSRVSRRFVAKTTAQLRAWQSAPLEGTRSGCPDPRRRPHRRTLPGGGARHRGGRPETCARPLGGSDRERSRLSELAGESAEPRSADRPEHAGDSRWRSGAPQGHAGGLWRGRAHSAVPGPQASEYPGPLAGAAAPVGAGDRAAGLSGDRRENGDPSPHRPREAPGGTNTPVRPGACARGSRRR